MNRKGNNPDYRLRSQNIVRVLIGSTSKKRQMTKIFFINMEV